MVVPPLPWRSIESGGLLFTPQKVMRTRTEAQLQALNEAEAALPNGMRKVLLGLPLTSHGKPWDGPYCWTLYLPCLVVLTCAMQTLVSIYAASVKIALLGYARFWRTMSNYASRQTSQAVLGYAKEDAG